MNRFNMRYSTIMIRLKLISTVLLHPAFIMALAVLLLNDHVWKASYPSILTGKLSDFAGLFIFPVVLFVVMPGALYKKRMPFYLAVFTAASFTIWKLAPIEIFLEWLSSISPVLAFSRVKDPTDLIAFVVLPLAVKFIETRKEVSLSTYSLSKTQHGLAISLLCLSVFSIMATGDRFVDAPNMDCCRRIRGNVDSDEIGWINVSDLTYLSAYLYSNGPRPDCIEEADVNGSEDRYPITVEDLEYLTSYLFEDGPPPADCRRELRMHE